MGLEYEAGIWAVIGHSRAIARLRRAIEEGNIAHAYLLTGPAQVGKTTLARSFAQALNCTGSTVPCHLCRACRLIAQDRHPDVRIIAPEGKTLKIEQVRALQREATLAPVEGRYRVYILTEMESATTEAANALLKTLEEPPPRVVFLLTATNRETLLPTVVSRCQHIPLHPVPIRVIANALEQGWNVPSEQAYQIASLSEGRVGWALTALQDPTLVERRMQWVDELDELLARGHTERMLYAQALSRSDEGTEVLETWITWWRDVLLVGLGNAPQTFHDREKELQEWAVKYPPLSALQALRTLRQTLIRLRDNVNPQLAFEAMALDLPGLPSAK